jgi:hypothetical protein
LHQGFKDGRESLEGKQRTDGLQGCETRIKWERCSLSSSDGSYLEFRFVISTSSSVRSQNALCLPAKQLNDNHVRVISVYDSDFLRKVVTGDEAWYLLYTPPPRRPKSKIQPSIWKSPWEPKCSSRIPWDRRQRWKLFLICRSSRSSSLILRFITKQSEIDRTANRTFKHTCAHLNYDRPRHSWSG